MFPCVFFLCVAPPLLFLGAPAPIGWHARANIVWSLEEGHSTEHGLSLDESLCVGLDKEGTVSATSWT